MLISATASVFFACGAVNVPGLAGPAGSVSSVFRSSTRIGGCSGAGERLREAPPSPYPIAKKPRTRACRSEPNLYSDALVPSNGTLDVGTLALEYSKAIGLNLCQRLGEEGSPHVAEQIVGSGVHERRTTGEFQWAVICQAGKPTAFVRVARSAVHAKASLGFRVGCPEFPHELEYG